MAFCVLSIVDPHTRECVRLVATLRLRAYDVLATLSALRNERAMPAVI